MTTTVLLTGERHRVVAGPDDRGMVQTACSQVVVLGRYDPDSAYQRAVFPLAAHPKPCTRCVS